MGDIEYSEVRKCGHCHNVGPMKIVASGEDSVCEFDDRGGLGWQERTTYVVLICASCNKPTLKTKYVDSATPPWGEPEVSILYPQSSALPLGLPANAQKAYMSAQKVKHVDANSFAVQLRRMLEFICKDQQATGSSLAAKLRNLSDRNLIPDKLAEIAKHLKDFGNVGAHAEDFDLTKAEIPILDSLARAVAEYIYTAPTLAKQAEDRFRELKGEKEE